MLCPLLIYTWYSCIKWSARSVIVIIETLFLILNVEFITFSSELIFRLPRRQQASLICSHTNEMRVFLKWPRKHKMLLSQIMFSFRLTASMASGNPVWCTVVVTDTFWQSVGQHIAMGALVDGLRSQLPGGRLIRVISNNSCGHNYEGRHWGFSLLLLQNRAVIDILWSVHF